MGSLTTKIIEHSNVIPVWIVDGEVTSTKILLSVDASESSLRAIDHFSFIAAANPNIKLTLFHANPLFHDYCMIDFAEKDLELEEIVLQAEQKCIDHFMSKIRKMFRDAGIQDSQMDILEVKCTGNPGKVIIDEAVKGGYGTVVIGRSGTSRSFFMGSVSHYVIQKTSDRAIWLVP
jgi:nucleotide-binding universal stress UspA family protein